MTPTLNPQWATLGVSAPRDWVILDRTKTASQEWEVGDIVVFVSPTNPHHLYTKRLIGLSGDVIRYRNKRKVQNPDGSTREVEGWARVRIPTGHCWVESDSSLSSPGKNKHGHTDLSRDSRHFGPIPMGLLTAKVSLIVWPLNRIGWPASRPDLKEKRIAKPGQPGKLRRGWWPFGGGDTEDSIPKKLKQPIEPPIDDGLPHADVSVLYVPDPVEDLRPHSQRK